VLGVALLQAAVDLGDLAFEVVDQRDRAVMLPRQGSGTCSRFNTLDPGTGR
jgi:hypothetical protein